MGQSDFSSYSSSIEDLNSAGASRLGEAKVLLDAGYHAGAILQGHYAVGIAIKRYIVRSRNLTRLQKPYQTHDIRQLLHAAGLYGEAVKGIVNPMRREVIVVSSHPQPTSAMQNWQVVLMYTEIDIVNLRYVSTSVISKADASRHFEAISLPPNGVIPWLDRRT